MVAHAHKADRECGQHQLVVIDQKDMKIKITVHVFILGIDFKKRQTRHRWMQIELGMYFSLQLQGLQVAAFTGHQAIDQIEAQASSLIFLGRHGGSAGA